MYRIVYIGEMYYVMNLLTEEYIGSFEFKSDAKEALQSVLSNGGF
jgi:hypothetical protein